MRRALLTLLVLLVIAPVGASSQGAGVSGCDVYTLLDELPEQRLRRREKKNLLFMREEEKLARDVYLSLHETWGLRLFRQIASSEATHMGAALVLIEKYELEDPVGDHALGVFTNEDLQALYEDLAAAGQGSLLGALQVGAAIEELDLYDLQRVYRRTNNEDLKLLYQNLMKGSRNHLRSFMDVLTLQGGSYEPALLAPEEFQAIFDSPREAGVVGADGESLCGGGWR